MVDPEVRAVLEQRSAENAAQLRRLAVDETSLLHDRADATADDEHDPEGSTLSGEWARIEVLRRAAAEQRVAIDEALQRIERGEYGVCANCGDPIPHERLLARPETAFCVRCAR